MDPIRSSGDLCLFGGKRSDFRRVLPFWDSLRRSPSAGSVSRSCYRRTVGRVDRQPFCRQPSLSCIAALYSGLQAPSCRSPNCENFHPSALRSFGCLFGRLPDCIRHLKSRKRDRDLLKPRRRTPLRGSDLVCRSGHPDVSAILRRKSPHFSPQPDPIGQPLDRRTLPFYRALRDLLFRFSSGTDPVGALSSVRFKPPETGNGRRSGPNSCRRLNPRFPGACFKRRSFGLFRPPRRHLFPFRESRPDSSLSLGEHRRNLSDQRLPGNVDCRL